MITVRHFTVHEADVAFYAAWRDGQIVRGAFARHLSHGLTDDYRAGLTIRQEREAGGSGGAFGEWRKHGGDPGEGQDGWMLEMKLPLVAVNDQDEQVTSWPDAGSPVVVVVRFLDKETGDWRVWQFHDAVLLPVDAGDESQNMMRTVRVSAGWMEDRYSGLEVPSLEPVVRGVIEWRHAGRKVRAWEYDSADDLFIEGGENVSVVDEEERRYVELEYQDEGLDVERVTLHYMAAATGEVLKAGGLLGHQVGWEKVSVVQIDGETGLNFWPGWEMEDEGAAEPLALATSGRHWEHSRVVFRVLGRVYASFSHGIFAVPSLQEGVPPAILDVPIRIGRLLLLPDGAWLLPQGWREL